MEESFTEDNSIGFKLQQFYVALRSLNSADIAWYLSLIETHVPNLDIGETSTIVNELIFDCRSKCTQYFRAVYGEQIRNLIASSRKKIHSKAAVEIHASSQHHQRHIVILIDLLGSWSNMILELSSFGLSPIVRQMIALPLHGRIREMVLEIFFAFKEDKNLDKLQSRILSHQDQMLKSKNDMNTATLNAPSSSYKIPVSFSTLDQILVQLTTIRETVNQYYSFLRAHLLAPVSDIAEFLDVDIGSDGGSVAISTETQVYTILNELNIDWRESDAYYISLEYGYITEALVDALSCSSLLETENMTLIPQSIEDAFFLFRRISERSIIGFNEQTIFAIANKIIELLDPSQDSNIYLIASEKKYFFNCTTRQSIIVPDSLKATSGNTFNATATDAQKSNSIPATPQIDLKAHGSNPSIVILPSSSSTSNISSNQPTDLGSWIVQALQDEVDTYEEQKAIKHISSGTSEVPSATSLLMTTGYSFLHQLVGDDSDEEDARQREHSRKVSVQQAAAGNISFSGTSNIDETDSGNTAEDSIMSRMKLVDFCVYLSTLVTCVTSIQSLRSFHIQALEFHQDIKRQQQQKHSTNEVSTAAVGLSNSNPLLLIQHELIRCIRGYHSLYQRDLRELVSLVFAQTFLPQLRVFFHSHR